MGKGSPLGDRKSCTICGHPARCFLHTGAYCWSCVNFCNGCGVERDYHDIAFRDANEVRCKVCEGNDNADR